MYSRGNPTETTARRLVVASLVAVVSTGAMIAPSRVHAQTAATACGDPFRNHFGPFDYRTAPPATRKMVEDFHFTPGIESMTRPVNTMMHEMAQDVSYTLGVFPNHARALVTMRRLSEKYKADPAPGTTRSVECWFDRAIRFRPEDTVPRALYAQFLAKRKRKDEAISQLEIAATHAQDNPLSIFNIGLVYLEMEQYDRALKHAHQALKLGYPRTELSDELKRLNKWAEPDTQ